MYCILLTLYSDNSHFAIPDGFAKSQSSFVLQEYFQNDEDKKYPDNPVYPV
jgi:hypothetical protein